MNDEHLKEAARLIRLLADRVPAHREAAEAWLAADTRRLVRTTSPVVVFDPYGADGYVWASDGSDAPRWGSAAETAEISAKLAALKP